MKYDAAQEIVRGNIDIRRAPTTDHVEAELWYQR